VLSDGFPAIDFLNTDRQVFQATIGANPDMKGWVDLLLDAKILSLGDGGKLTIIPNAQPLEFYWVVPEDRQGSWAKRKPKVPKKDDIPQKYDKQRAMITQAIERHVHQFVIFIEKDPPVQSEFWSAWNPIVGLRDSCLLM